MGRIGPHGIVHLLKDLRLSSDDRKVLILAWQLKAEVSRDWGEERNDSREIPLA